MVKLINIIDRFSNSYGTTIDFDKICNYIRSLKKDQVVYWAIPSFYNSIRELQRIKRLKRQGYKYRYFVDIQVVHKIPITNIVRDRIREYKIKYGASGAWWICSKTPLHPPNDIRKYFTSFKGSYNTFM